jgi:hypothetical protein
MYSVLWFLMGEEAVHIYWKKKLRGFSPQANYTDRVTADAGEVSANFSW